MHKRNDADRGAFFEASERLFIAFQYVALDRRHLIQLAITGMTVLMAILFRASIGTALMLGLLAASASGFVDGRVFVIVGVLCLAGWPVLMIGEQNAWLQQSPLVNYYVSSMGLYSLRVAADTLTTWAFYFLGIGLIGRIIGYVRQGTRWDSTR